MASKHSSGPGTNTRGGVVSTMENSNKVKTSGQQNGMTGTFGAPRSGGNGGSNIPTHVYDQDMPKAKVPAPSQKSVYGAEGGQKRPGSK